MAFIQIPAVSSGALSIVFTSTDVASMSANTLYIVDNSGADVNMSLPDPAANSGKLFYVKTSVSGNGTFVNPFASETIDGGGGINVGSTNSAVILACDGTNWWKIAVV